MRLEQMPREWARQLWGRIFQVGETAVQRLEVGVCSWGWCVHRTPWSGRSARSRGGNHRDEIGEVTCLSFWVRWESLRVLSRGVVNSFLSFKGLLWLLWEWMEWARTSEETYGDYCSHPCARWWAWTRLVAVEVEKRLDSWFILR